MRKRQWGIIACVVLAAVGSLAVATGVGHADELTFFNVRLKWNINLTDVGDRTCAQTSAQMAVMTSDNDLSDTFDMVAPNWEERCGDAYSRVRSVAQRRSDGRIEIRTSLSALLNGITYGEKSATLVVTPDQGIVSADIKLDSSSEATAFGHFVGSVHTSSDFESPQAYNEVDLSSNDVSGQATAYLYRTGQYVFAGHLHNDGFSSKDVKVTCAVHLTDGKVLMFDASGDANGTLTSINSDKNLNWSQSGNNRDLQDAWQDGTLTDDTPLQCALSVTTDTAADVLGGATIIIDIARAILGI